MSVTRLGLYGGARGVRTFTPVTPPVIVEQKITRLGLYGGARPIRSFIQVTPPDISENPITRLGFHGGPRGLRKFVPVEPEVPPIDPPIDPPIEPTPGGRLYHFHENRKRVRYKDIDITLEEVVDEQDIMDIINIVILSGVCEE